ncbi:MAG: fibronectin type III domain-containing protein [Clostridia bacterium]|nr:fibronectin type III domain-containing protein [Clostridia bacterium]
MKKALIKVLLIAMTLVTLITVIPLSANATSDNKTQIFSYLTNEMGLNSAAACGIMANIEKESNFKPSKIIRDSNGLQSGGLCMWNGSRLSRLKNYCNNKGLNYLSIKGQLSYLAYELKLSQYKHIFDYIKNVPNNSKGAYDAAYYWCYYFEIPASRGSRSVQRGNSAVKSYWPTYGNKKISAPEISLSSEKTIFDLDSSLTIKWTSGGDNADEYKVFVAKKNKKTGDYNWKDAKTYSTTALKQKIKTNSLGSGDFAAYVRAINSATDNYKDSQKIKFTVKCITHEYTGEVISSPTLATTGTEKLTCSVCKTTKTEIIPILTNEALSEYPMTAPKASARTTDSITLTWTEFTGATGYNIYLRVDNKWKNVGTAEGVTEYTVTGLESGTKYKFAIKAFVTEVVPTETESVTNTYRTAYSASYTTATKADMVKLESAKADGNKEVVLKWTQEAKADVYEIYMSVDGITFERAALIKDGTDTAHRLKNLTPGRIYYFRIHPYVEAGDHTVYSSSSNVRASLVRI